MATRTNITYISPVDIKEYIICPRRLTLQRQKSPELFPGPGHFFDQQHLYFNREPNSDDILFATFRDAIKVVLTLILKRKWKKDISWNGVRTAIGLAMSFRAKLGLEIPTDATRLIELVESFYRDYLIGGRRLIDIPIYPNFPVLVPLGKGRVWGDILHALGRGEKGNILLDFRLKPTASHSYTEKDFEQDSLMAARLWGLKAVANEPPYNLVIFYFGASNGIKVKSFTLYCETEYDKYTAQHMKNMTHIIEGIYNNVCYASKRPDCQYCVYKEVCDNM